MAGLMVQSCALYEEDMGSTLGGGIFWLFFVFLKQTILGDKTLFQTISNDIFLNKVNFYIYVSMQKMNNFYLFYFKKHNYIF
jgi:hypothetical protein